MLSRALDTHNIRPKRILVGNRVTVRLTLLVFYAENVRLRGSIQIGWDLDNWLFIGMLESSNFRKPPLWTRIFISPSCITARYLANVVFFTPSGNCVIFVMSARSLDLHLPETFQKPSDRSPQPPPHLYIQKNNTPGRWTCCRAQISRRETLSVADLMRYPLGSSKISLRYLPSPSSHAKYGTC